jgi:hypothetical protein
MIFNIKEYLTYEETQSRIKAVAEQAIDAAAAEFFESRVKPALEGMFKNAGDDIVKVLSDIGQSMVAQAARVVAQELGGPVFVSKRDPELPDGSVLPPRKRKEAALRAHYRSTSFKNSDPSLGCGKEELEAS